MECPYCLGPTWVSDSRRMPGGVRRRRKCHCGKRFTTYEMTDKEFKEQRVRLTKKQLKLTLLEVINEVVAKTT